MQKEGGNFLLVQSTILANNINKSNKNKINFPTYNYFRKTIS